MSNVIRDIGIMRNNQKAMLDMYSFQWLNCATYIQRMADSESQVFHHCDRRLQISKGES